MGALQRSGSLLGHRLRKWGEEVEVFQAGQEESCRPWGIWDPRMVGLGGLWEGVSP